MFRRCLQKSAAWLAAASLLATTAASAPAQAFSPFLVVPDPAVAEASPAYRYANMTDAQAFAELEQRGILYEKLDNVFGVRAPIRLTGRLHGVYVHSSLPPEERVRSDFEILDARLALALDDFCALLERHDIDELVHFTMYRPNLAKPEDRDPAPKSARVASKAAERSERATRAHSSSARPAKKTGKSFEKPAKPAATKKTAPKQKTAEKTTKKPAAGVKTARKASTEPSKARPSKPPQAHAKDKKAGPAKPMTPYEKTTWAAPGTRHPAGMAIDVGMLHKRDGRWLSVQGQFRGKIGEQTCGAGSRVPDDEEARELRAIVCEASDLGIFTYALTPNYNAAHHDHFHMEIKAGVKWFLYN